jgi:hypothetical protein
VEGINVKDEINYHAEKTVQMKKRMAGQVPTSQLDHHDHVPPEIGINFTTTTLVSNGATTSNRAAPNSVLYRDGEDKSKLLLAICGGGICTCYLLYGMVQEHLYKFKSPETGEKMSCTLFLLLLQVRLFHYECPPPSPCVVLK